MNYNVTFSTKFGYYRARFWDNCGYDTKAKVPDEFWEESGMNVPAEHSDKAHRVAMKWAAAEANRRHRDMATHGGIVRSGRMTLREVFDLYKKENPSGVTLETMEREEISFNAIARHLPVDSILPEQVDEPVAIRYRNRRSQDKVLRRGKKGVLFESENTVRNRTVNNELDLLQRMVKFAWRWKSVTGMAAVRLDEFERMPEQESNQVALTYEEVAEILKFCTPEKKAKVIFGICSRLRESNLLGLRGEWISWKEDWLEIPSTEMKKGRSRSRFPLSIPLPKIAMEQLGPAKLSGYIWPNPETGLPYTRLGCDRLAEAAQVRPFSEHDLRTTGITWLYLNGVDDLARMMLAGHTHSRDATGSSFTVKTRNTTDVYTKVAIERLRQAVAVYDQIFARIIRPEMKLVSISGGSSESA
jgi:integrase